MYRTGLKKWVTRKVLLEVVGAALSHSLDGQPEVFEETIAPVFRTSSRRPKTCCLMSRRSTTTSTIQSQSESRAQSSSKLPISISGRKRFE